jgi:hypothetical protein
MGFSGDDAPGGLERNLRANRPQLDSDVEDRILSGVAPTGGRRMRVLAATVLTVGVFGVMSAFGGISYAGQVLGGNSSPTTPAGDQYCPTNAEPDHNGDVHSNCHTGSKFRGAGGEDKPGAKG